MNSKQWVQSLTKPILVVGNSVLPHPIPEEDYASVVRLNNYTLGGWSGNKVTHWVANGYQDVQDHPIRPVVIPWSLACAKKRGNPGDVFQSRIGAENIIHLINDRHIQWWFPLAVVHGRCFPSTGFCFLSWMLFLGIRPDIVGFDGMKTGHQGDPTYPHGHIKTKVREWHLIRQWGLRRR